MASINPYLYFSGNCEEAFNFYKSIFGSEFSSFQRFKDVPRENPLPEGEEQWVLHVELPIGKGTVLMGCDSPSARGNVVSGNNFNISILCDSSEETDRLFTDLSAGGQVSMPLQETYWEARFGMFTDKFGIQWMINQYLDAQG